MEIFLNSFVYQIIDLVLNILSLLTITFAILLYRHTKKLEYLPKRISGGNSNSNGKVKEATEYYNSRWSKFMRHLERIISFIK